MTDRDALLAEAESWDNPCGRRPMKVYPITDTELAALMWLPFWARWKMLRRIKHETIHEEDEIC